jgi:hypothetical protein
MQKYDLSILIPSRNEMFVSNTVEDILKNRRGKTEVIVGLDGAWAEPGIADHPDVRIVYVSQSLGQRGMTNLLAKLSKSKYVAKSDAHCTFDEGFDVKLMEAMEGHDDWTIVPNMRNLHAFDWICPDGHRRYQGPSGPCLVCKKPTERDIVWRAKPSPNSTTFCFDSEPHFQYFNEWKKKQEGDIVETMSLQGSFFMLTRDKYWELNICNEAFGSWGSQGIEVAAKTWLSGGRVVCHRGTYYAHMFRTQGGDFGFPYHNPQTKVHAAKKHAKNLFLKGKDGTYRWPQQTRDLVWLLDRFWPVRGWSEEQREIVRQNKSW